MNYKKEISTINSYASQFMRMSNAFELSRLVQVEFYNFIRIVENANYLEFNIPKAKGGKRTIEAPDGYLSIVQKRLNIYLQALYYKIKPNEVFGFVQSAKGEKNPKTIVTNAQKHIGKSQVLNIDLKDFFHSISADRVRSLFVSEPFSFSADLATCIALTCCWKGRLPMGAPTSPVVSNLICLGLDEHLIALSKKYNFDYTRYADDLTFSSNDTISTEAIADIKKVITENKFTINERKFRLQSKFRQQNVTGIKVNQKTNVDRRYIRNIRAILNDIKWNGLEKAAFKHYGVNEVGEKMINTFLSSLGGKIGFIGQVRGKDDLIYNKLRQELRTYQPALT